MTNPASPKPVSTREVMALVFGILAFTSCPLICAVPAIVLAQGQSSGVARAAAILGWINLGLCVLVLFAAGCLAALGALSGQF